MDYHAQFLELCWFLLPFMVTILDYLNFNRQKIGLRVKSLKYNHSLLNNIQAVIQKTQNSSLPHPLFQTVMVSINFYSKIYWNTKQFCQQKYWRRIKSMKSKIFLQKAFMHYSQSTKKKFPHYIVGIVVVAISLSDANIKVL